MCFFKKKKKRLNNELLKEKYLTKFELLRNMAKSDESLFSDIETTREKFEKLTLSKNKDVLAVDDKIYEKIDDLHEVMSKYSKSKEGLVRDLLSKIEELMVERKYLTKDMEPSPETDFEIEDGTLVCYKGNGGTIILPKTIKIIGTKAFYSNDSIKSITVSEGVTSIEEDAFNMCSGLTTVYLPASLASIGQSAFYNCKALTYVEFCEGIGSVNYYAFAKCVNMKVNKIPMTLVNIKDNAFEGCKMLNDAAVRAIKKRNKKAL